jgi:RimJ/RimL family protein N-acetyltransferase
MTLLEQIPRQTFHEASIPVLETKRLALRASRPEDAKTVAALANDRRIAENTARIPHPYQTSDAEGFITGANKAGGEAMFLITLRDETVIGACGIMLQEQTPELGYWLGVPYWGKGYATEALHAAIDYAFTDLGHEALQAGARVTNPASRRVLEKCGFQWTGVRLARVRAVLLAAPAPERRGLRVLRILRRLPGRLHGGQVLHRPAAGRA